MTDEHVRSFGMTNSSYALSSDNQQLRFARMTMLNFVIPTAVEESLNAPSTWMPSELVQILRFASLSQDDKLKVALSQDDRLKVALSQDDR